MSNVLVEIDNLTKRFGAVTALKHIHLEFMSGRIIGLLGPNGSGKTTLIKMLNGLLVPDEGFVKIEGKLPGKETKSLISYLPDKPYFADWMRVNDLLDFFADFYEDFDRHKAVEMCELMHIDMKQKMKKLSKGTKEKVQLILVMSRNAKLYLLDEPIGGVDPAARDMILRTIINNYNEDGCVLISTHLIADVERVLDEAVFINEGVIIRHDNVDALRDEMNKPLDEIFREQFAVKNIGGTSNVG